MARSLGAVLGRISCMAAMAALLLAFDARLDAAEPANALGIPEQAVTNKGTLFILGGGKAPESVYEEFVKLAGGPKARLVIVASAYGYRDKDQIERRFGGWRKMGAESVVFLDAKSREEADSAVFIRPLTRATGVWLAGGSQSRLMSLCGGTKTEAAIRDVFNHGGIVGGTSAGAAAMSRLMIRYGATSAVLGQGIGLLEKAVVDQHFSQRGRYGRLLGVLDEHRDLVGVGVDERTAAVVQGNTLRVLGESQVVVCVPVQGQGTVVYPIKTNQQADLGQLRRGMAIAKAGK